MKYRGFRLCPKYVRPDGYSAANDTFMEKPCPKWDIVISCQGKYTVYR